MALVTDVVAKLRADTTGFTSGFKTAEQSVSNFAGVAQGGVGKSAALGGAIGGIAKIAGGVGVALAGAGVVSFFKQTVDAASNLAETTSKVSVIFGEASTQIGEWSAGASKSFGQSQQQAMDAASTFAAFGKSAGMSGDDLAGFSTGLTELASDLGSFYNTDPSEAIFAIGAALRGESEPIRRYNIMLDDATLRQEAFAQGITDSIKTALTPQQKVLAAQAAIMKQSSDAQGDFARTSDGLANSQRTLSATIADIKSQVGAGLLPAITEITQALGPFLQALAGPLAEVAKTIGTVLTEAFKQLTPLLPPIAALLGTLVKVLGNNLTSALSALIPVIIPVVDILTKLMAQIIPVLNPIITKLVSVVGALLSAVLPLLPPLADLVLNIFNAAAPILNVAADMLLSIAGALGPVIAAVSQLLPPISTLITIVFAALKPILDPLLPLIDLLGKMLGEHLVRMIGVLMIALGGLIFVFGKVASFMLENFTKPIAENFMAMVGKLLDGAKTLARFIPIPGISDKVDEAIAAFDGLQTGVSDGIQAAIDTISTEGVMMGKTMADQGLAMFMDPTAPMAAGSTLGFNITQGIAAQAGAAYDAGAILQNAALDGIGNRRVASAVGFAAATAATGAVTAAATDAAAGAGGGGGGSQGPSAETLRVRALAEGMAAVEAYGKRVAGAIASRDAGLRAAGEQVAAAMDSVASARASIRTAESVRERAQAEIDLTAALRERRAAYDALADAEKNVGKASAEAVQAAGDAGNRALNRLKETAAAAINLMRQVKGQTADFAAITSIDAPQGASPSARAMISNMQDRLSRIRQFGKALRDLQGLGLNKGVMADIIAAGPDAGLQIAQAILTEGKTAVTDLNKTQKAINTASAGVGDIAAQSQYGMTSGQAQSVIDTQVNINLAERSVYVDFAAGVTAADKAEITTAVNTAVDRALQRARREANRR